MAQIRLTTTGTLSPVTINDLGAVDFVHPTTNFVLFDTLSASTSEYTIEQIRDSSDLQAAVDAGYITLDDEFGTNITSISQEIASVIDGDHISIDFIPSNYTRTLDPGVPTDELVDLSSHLKGIDVSLGNSNAWTVTTGSTTYLTNTTNDLGIGITNPTNLLEVRRVNPGQSNHVQFIVDDGVKTDDYNLGLDTTDPGIVQISTEDGTYRQAMVFASDGSGADTTFGVSTSTNSGVDWFPRFIVRTDGNVGINTVSSATTSTLTLDGTLKLLNLGGSDANGYVLTSDGSGNATWQAVSGGTGGGLESKSGNVVAASFDGNPKTVTVAFSTAFADTNYSISVTPEVNNANSSYVISFVNKTVNGFTISTGTNSIQDLVSVDWIAIKHGES